LKRKYDEKLSTASLNQKDNRKIKIISEPRNPSENKRHFCQKLPKKNKAVS
jgi:hypothetical protein